MFKEKHFDYDFSKIAKKSKIATIIVSIVAIILGILMIVLPLASAIIYIWIFVGLAGLGSLGLIIRFIIGKWGRNGAELVLGILGVLCVAGLITMGALSGDITIEGHVYTGFQKMSVVMIVYLGIFIGVFAFCSGIFRLCTITSVVKGSKGIVIANSILSIVLGILMFTLPLVGVGVYMIIAGVYLIAVAIAALVFIASFGGSFKKPEPKEEKKDNVEDADIDEKK